MTATFFAYIAHQGGAADDSAFELITAARQIDPEAAVKAVVTGHGADLDAVCSAAAQVYPEVVKIGHEALAYPNAEVVRKALLAVLPAGAVVLLPHNTFGMDLGPGLAVKLGVPFLSDTVAVDSVSDGLLTAVRQEYGGQVSTHVQCDISGGAVINVRGGSFAAEEERSAGGSVTGVSEAVGDLGTARRFLEVVQAEVGDVDITKADVLVSVGRGIEDEENIELAEELAEAMGAVVSCSRPIVDAKWLEKSRQVGTSGKTVKPKVYLAMGISGSFQHLGGLKGNPFVVAVNKNAKAPIFQAADVGIVADILDFIPELKDKIEAL
jgi:electron transfer flavoprotein alpha subunit